MPLLPPVGTMFGTLRRIPFVIWLLLAQFFVFAGAAQIAPAGEVQHFKDIIIFYMLFQVALLAYWKKRPKWMQTTLNQGIAWFIGGFVITVFVLVGIGAAKEMLGFGTVTYSITAPLYLALVHTLVVAFSEEAIFRGMLCHIMTPIVGNIGFALFHFWAYGGSWMGMLIAFMAGMLFYVVMRKTNIFAAMGLHAGYNTTILGVWG